MADLYIQNEQTEKTPISIPSAPYNPEATDSLISRRSTYANDANAKYCRLFKTKLGVLSLFGLIYWLTISFTAYFSHNHSQSWLFTYSVTSCVIAVILQFCVMAMVVYGLNEHNQYINWSIFKHLKTNELPVTSLSVFPYSLMIVIDLFVHIGVSFGEREYILYSMAFIICHIISLFSITLSYFEWHRGDKFFRFVNFGFEWLDILSQIAVALIYAQNSTSPHKDVVTNVFWSFILIQLMFWTLPILLGAAQTKQKIAVHIILLDIVTDIPLVITTLASGAYKVQFWILCDLFVKVLLMARGVIYNVCLHIFLPYLLKK